MHGLRATQHVGVPVDGMLRPMKKDGTALQVWSQVQLQAHQTQRARAFDSMMAAQTLRLEQSPEPLNMILAALMHLTASKSRQTLGSRVVRVPAAMLKDFLELPALPAEMSQEEAKELIDPAIADVVLSQFKHLSSCLGRLETAFGAPIATLLVLARSLVLLLQLLDEL